MSVIQGRDKQGAYRQQCRPFGMKYYYRPGDSQSEAQAEQRAKTQMIQAPAAAMSEFQPVSGPVIRREISRLVPTAKEVLTKYRAYEKAIGPENAVRKLVEELKAPIPATPAPKPSSMELSRTKDEPTTKRVREPNIISKLDDASFDLDVVGAVTKPFARIIKATIGDFLTNWVPGLSGLGDDEEWLIEAQNARSRGIEGAAKQIESGKPILAGPPAIEAPADIRNVLFGPENRLRGLAPLGIEPPPDIRDVMFGPDAAPMVPAIDSVSAANIEKALQDTRAFNARLDVPSTGDNQFDAETARMNAEVDRARKDTQNMGEKTYGFAFDPLEGDFDQTLGGSSNVERYWRYGC